VERKLTDLADLDVVHYPHDPLLPTIWRLRFNLPAYDAAHVALAIARDTPLLSLDQRITATTGHGASSDVIR